MGLEVSKVSDAEVQKKDLKLATKRPDDKSELSKALSSGQTSSAADKKSKALPTELKKKEGLSTGAKLGIGAALVGAAGTALYLLKPSLGKAVKTAAKLATHSNQVQKGLKASHALGAVGALAGASILAGGCANQLEEIHNHLVPLPSDSIPYPEYVEKIIEKPIYITETDTIYQIDSIPVIVEKTDTLWKTDTLKVPEYITKWDTLWLHDTVPQIVEKTDTLWKIDTLKILEYITKWDTVWKDKIDTQYVEKPVYIEVPGETIYVKEDFESEVPEKMKEMLQDLGIDTTGVGKFVYGLDWQDNKNNQVHRTLWDGGRTSRDGDVYIMNDIGTKWSNPDETYVFGKNEEFRRHELYVNDSEQLSNCVNLPAQDINVSNGNGAPNWYIFDPDQSTAEPGNWLRQAPVSFKKVGDGVWESSDGFRYERGPEPNTIRKINQYGSEWLLKNISVIGGNDAKDPQ